MKVAVIGADGQLGSDVVAAFTAHSDTVLPLTHRDLEVSEMDSVSRVLREASPDVIVNTSAMHHVENCEREPGKALAVNAIGPRNLAQAAEDLGAILMHVSTDYVFDGAKGSPYLEDDAPNPLNAYGTSKLAGESFVRHTAKKHFVIRTSALYGRNPCRAKGGLNFVELMLKLSKERDRLRVVDSEFVTPTATRELAEQIYALSRSDSYGLYHATAEGSCSWHEFAREIFLLTGTSVALEVALPNEFPAKVARPKYSVLENRALKNHGLNLFKTWREGLHDYLGERVKRSPVRISS